MRTLNKTLKENSAGALLFTIVFVFLLSFTSAALFTLITNQCQMIYAEIESVENDYILQAGMVYAYEKLANGNVCPNSYTFTMPDGGTKTIKIDTTTEPGQIKVSI